MKPRTLKALEKDGLNPYEIYLFQLGVKAGFSSVKLRKWISDLKSGDGIPSTEDDFLDRIKSISLLGKDSISALSFELRFGPVSGQKLRNLRIEGIRFDKDKFIERYGEDDAQKRLSRNGASLENFIRRHGEKEGTKRWTAYKQNRKNTYTSKKAAGRNYNSFSMETYKKKYGNEEGFERWEKMRQSRNSANTKQSLIERFGQEEANVISKRRWSNNSRDTLISRLGLEAGTARFNELVKMARCNMSLDYLIEKHGDEEGYRKWVARCWKSSQPSKISMLFKDGLSKFVDNIEVEVPVHLNQSDRKRANQKIFYCDFKIDDKIIEFFGDIWHANPKLFEDGSTPNPFAPHVTADQIRARDLERISILEEKGFKVLVVWEQDFKNDPNLTIEKSVKWIKEK